MHRLSCRQVEHASCTCLPHFSPSYIPHNRVLRYSSSGSASDIRQPYAGMNVWEQDADIHRFAHGTRLARIAANLMGVRGVRLYHDQALRKQPGGGQTPWHADQARSLLLDAVIFLGL